ncbi:hypothetical protein [Agromyces sp. NPDC057865]|uniref:hypothetical protein n=1 Tax=Agromyces sp. NPDC057865 TaxID=3346267 RepID=UPI00366AD9BF
MRKDAATARLGDSRAPRRISRMHEIPLDAASQRGIHRNLMHFSRPDGFRDPFETGT